MSQFNASGAKSFKTGVAALARYQRVKLASGVLQLAMEDEAAVGFVDGFVGASADVVIGDVVTVRLFTSAGTFKAIVNEAVSVSAILYGGDDGKLQSTDPGSGTARFMALEAGSGNNSVIEVLPLTLA